MTMRALVVIIVAIVVCSQGERRISFAGDSTPATENLGSRPQLFVDRRLIDRCDGLRLVLHRPQSREIAFTFDADWEGPQCAYVTVLRDENEYRMYYRAGGETTQEFTAIATSKDGVHWTRPKLALFEFWGNKNNNIIYRGERKAYTESHNFTPFIDANPAASPDHKYKAVAMSRVTGADGKTIRGLVGLTSSNGIHWSRSQANPMITDGSFDSQNVAFWDTNRGEYICYFRDGRVTSDGRRVRSIKRTTSQDFLKWTNPTWLDFGDTILEHFYVNAIQPYYRNPSLYIGLPMRFVPERRMVGADARKVDGVSDAVLITSHDGLRFDRTFMEAFLRPGSDPKNWGNAHGNQTVAWGMLPTAPGEISLYWAEHYGDVPRLRRGVLRVDGFASVQAPYSGGELLTRPFRFKGKQLLLNYSTSAVGGIRVEIQDAAGKPLSGFALNDCAEIYGDELERPVAWKKSTDVKPLEGKIVRLRVQMKDADWYSFRFQ